MQRAIRAFGQTFKTMTYRLLFCGRPKEETLVPKGGQNNWRTRTNTWPPKKVHSLTTFWPLFQALRAAGRPADGRPPSDEFENEFRTHFEFELISENEFLQRIIKTV